MNIYLSRNRVLLFILCSAYFYSFISITILPWSLYLASTVFCTFLIVGYLLLNIDIILMRRYRTVNLLALIYGISVLISVYMNGLMTNLALLEFILCISVFPFVEVQVEKGHVRFMCKVMLFWLCILLLANDVLMVIMPGRFYGDGISRNFLLGNKFPTGYDHIILLMLIGILYGAKPVFRRYMPLLFAAVCFICHYIDCNTAVLGTIVVFMIAYSPERVRTILSRRNIVLIAFVLSALFIYFDSILQLPSVKYFITDVLGRDLTLTGRIQIFKVIPKVIRAHPWIGYGSSAKVIFRYTDAYNAQNGFFDLAVQNGIPSALLFILLIVALIKKADTSEAGFMLGAIYGYIFMASVEITYGTALMLFGILLFTDSSDYSENQIKLIEWKG